MPFYYQCGYSKIVSPNKIEIDLKNNNSMCKDVDDKNMKKNKKSTYCM